MMWAIIVEDLESIGFGMATVHSKNNRQLASKVNVKELPN